LLSRRSFLAGVGACSVAGLTHRAFEENAFASPLKAAFGTGFQANSPDPTLVERARTLLTQAPFIETHNDLPSMLLEVKGDLVKYDLSKVQPKLCADIPRLREGGVGAQYWSVFVESATQKTHTSLHEAMREFDVALRIIRSQADFEQARTADDIERIHKAGKIACLIGVEGGHMIENSAASLRVFYDLGARYMTLTHWDNIDWADSATDRPEHYGLTGFGKQVVREMNRLGMFVDLSHVSANSMRDALSVTRAPVIFSHSSSFAVNPHPRNVPDDVLQKMPANGGVVHVNFIKEFISTKNQAWQDRRTEALRKLHLQESTDVAITKGMEEWEKSNPLPRPTITDVADHIDHIRQVAGIDHIGIGADYYQAGGESMAEGLEDVTRYPYLFAELLRRKYSDEDVLKIAGHNHLRAMRQMEKVAAELQKSEAPWESASSRSSSDLNG
jgi:membrane dipeptidase